MRAIIIQFVKFSLLVLVLAAGIAYVDYHILAPGREPDCNPANLEKGRICLSTLLAEWGDRIVWVDARGEDAFEKGSVKKGKVYPIRNDAHAQALLAAAMPALYQAGENDQCIVVFCDKSCNSSADIAAELEKYELDAPIFILEGGWDVIRKEPTLNL